MRRGLMLWREDELSVDDVRRRQRRLQEAMRAAGLNAVLVYTNHVRSGAVTYLTGFTPYWSDALLMVPAEGEPLFATALSKRVGNWIRTVNPTGEIAHSPQPGRLVGTALATAGARRVGVVELDGLPGGLATEVASAYAGEFIDATAAFASARGVVDPAEIRLAARADVLAREALLQTDPGAMLVGDVTGPAERAVRLAGAEECYVAVAPDLKRDVRLARIDGAAPLGESFALRLSVAYNGVWIRRTQTFARDAARGAAVAEIDRRLDSLCAELDLQAPLGPQLAGLGGWHLEAPVGTRPLKRVAEPGREPAVGLPYGVLGIATTGDHPVVAARPVGVQSDRYRIGAAAWARPP